MRKLYLVVEGHGETRAAGNLIYRLWEDLGLGRLVLNDPPARGLSLNTEAGVNKICEIVRRRPDYEGLLLLRDEDDHCPRERGPRTAAWLAAAGLPFPAATVLLHREYEALFLPCLDLMAGRPLADDRGQGRAGLRADARFDGDPQSVRGVKEWLSRHFDGNKSYKPTLDQLPLTRMIDFARLRSADLPCFGTLERALRFLHSPPDGEQQVRVYPPPP